MDRLSFKTFMKEMGIGFIILFIVIMLFILILFWLEPYVCSKLNCLFDTAYNVTQNG